MVRHAVAAVGHAVDGCVGPHAGDAATALEPVPTAHFVAVISPENSGLASAAVLRALTGVPLVIPIVGPPGPFSEYWFSSVIDATMPLLLRFASPESM